MTIDPTASRLAAAGVAYAPEISAAAHRHGVDPNLLAAVAAQETGGPGSNAGRNVVGDGGHGRGIFQIDDRWHDFARTPAAMDPAKNADYAAGMISGLLARLGGNVRRALSAYNAGSPDAVGTQTQWPGGRRLGYAESVLEHYSEIAGSPGPAALAGSQPPGGLAGLQPPEAASAHESAVAELGTLIAQLGALQSQAMSTPSPPSTQTPQSPPYQPQALDYGSLLAPDADN